MKLYAEVEEFLRLNELVKAGKATDGEREHWTALKEKVLARRKKTPWDDEPAGKPARGSRRRLPRTG